MSRFEFAYSFRQRSWDRIMKSTQKSLLDGAWVTIGKGDIRSGEKDGCGS